MGLGEFKDVGFDRRYDTTISALICHEILVAHSSIWFLILIGRFANLEA